MRRRGSVAAPPGLIPVLEGETLRRFEPVLSKAAVETTKPRVDIVAEPLAAAAHDLVSTYRVLQLARRHPKRYRSHPRRSATWAR